MAAPYSTPRQGIGAGFLEAGRGSLADHVDPCMPCTVHMYPGGRVLRCDAGKYLCASEE